jgi:hypothetical protein
VINRDLKFGGVMGVSIDLKLEFGGARGSTELSILGGIRRSTEL